MKRSSKKTVKQAAKEIVLILHNIRSAHNVGAIFRTADAAGIGQIYLTGYTPRPIDTFGRAVLKIAKVALGAENTVNWEHDNSIATLLLTLKRRGFQLVALEQSPRAADYKTVRLKPRSVVIVGNEVHGLTKAVLSRCDIIAEIPMHGRKKSLNVAVALGIALFRFLKI